MASIPADAAKVGKQILPVSSGALPIFLLLLKIAILLLLLLFKDTISAITSKPHFHRLYQMSYNLPEDGDRLKWKMKKSEGEIWIVKPPGICVLLFVVLCIFILEFQNSRSLLWKRDQTSHPS